MENIVIVGAGASGMMAALSAAEDRNNRVLLLERQQRAGRKLLATGNGRCNLCNMNAGPQNYHGEDESFPLPALRAFPPQAALDFFHGLGLLTVTESSGRVYPLSDSSNSVLDVLRMALDQAGVELRCSCRAEAIRREDGGWRLDTQEGPVRADKLIMACGGAAGAKLGGVMDGYELLKPLGHKRTRLLPALVQLLTAADYPRALKGVRADCALGLYRDGRLLARSRGELQFTETGVSGPAAFDLSRAAAAEEAGAELRIDLLKDYDIAAVLELLRRRREARPDLETGELFTGMLHNRLGRMLIKYCGLPQALPLSALDGEALNKAAEACKCFRLPLLGVEGFDKAQVTAGGIKTTGFDPETLESWFMPGLFACGELLDVDGDCGGYNLHWAWASGRLAGRLGK